MAKPNYAFEKRQRELEKRQKKEDKALKKAASPPAASHGGEAPAQPQSPATVAGDKTAS